MTDKKKVIKKATKKPNPNYRAGPGPVDTFDPPSNSGKESPFKIIPRIPYEWARYYIEGYTPLLTNQMTGAAKQQISKTEAGIKSVKRPPRDPEQECIDSAHVCYGKYEKDCFKTNLYGFPAIGLRKAMSSTAYRTGMLKNYISLSAYVFVHGPYNGLLPILAELSPIPTQKDKIREYVMKAITERGHTKAVPTMRSDIIHLPVAKSPASFCYRPEFTPWKLEVDIRYWPAMMSMESVTNLLMLTGESHGIGSWCSRHDGIFGMFKVASVTQLPSNYEPASAYGDISAPA